MKSIKQKCASLRSIVEICRAIRKQQEAIGKTPPGASEMLTDLNGCLLDLLRSIGKADTLVGLMWLLVRGGDKRHLQLINERKPIRYSQFLKFAAECERKDMRSLELLLRACQIRSIEYLTARLRDRSGVGICITKEEAKNIEICSVDKYRLYADVHGLSGCAECMDDGSYWKTSNINRDAYTSIIDRVSRQHSRPPSEIIRKAMGQLTLPAEKWKFASRFNEMRIEDEHGCHDGWTTVHASKISHVYKYVLFFAIKVLIAAAALWLVASITTVHLWREKIYLALLSLVAMSATRPFLEKLLGKIYGPYATVQFDYRKDGLPVDCLVLIAIPMLVLSKEQIDGAVNTAMFNIKQANDTNVRLCFLTDFKDKEEGGTNEEENSLLDYLHGRVTSAANEMGEMYGGCMAYMHRDRVRCERDGKWIGFERKRGKLELLNRLVVHGINGFSRCSTDSANFVKDVKYILCLDEDSKISRNTVSRLAGFLDHPANRPAITDSRIVSGHGIAVPLCSSEIAEKRDKDWLKHLSGPRKGINAEAIGARNFLQDMLGESPLSGKGMYAPKTYEVLCGGKIPDGIVLSHDTIEASLLRPGFVAGTRVTEAYPARLSSVLKRQERWIRGDIQNAWLLAADLTAGKRTFRSVTYFTVANQLVSWVAGPANFCALSMCIAGHLPANYYAAIFLLGVLQGITRFVDSIKTIDAKDAWRGMKMLGISGVAQYTRLAISPIQFFVAMKAIILVTWRLIRKKNLLEWTPAYVADKKGALLGGDLVVGSILISLLSIAVLTALLLANGEVGALEVLVLCTWSALPVVSFCDMKA